MALHLKSTGIDFADFSDLTETSTLLHAYEEGTWTAELSYQNGTAEGNKTQATGIGQYFLVGSVIGTANRSQGSYSGGNADNCNCNMPKAGFSGAGGQVGGSAMGFNNGNGMVMSCSESGTSTFATGNGGGNVTPQLPTTYNVTATNFYGTD